MAGEVLLVLEVEYLQAWAVALVVVDFGQLTSTATLEPGMTDTEGHR